MKKSYIALIVSIFFLTAFADGQTLFTYGDHSVDVSEFERAYKKNNTGPATGKEKSVREYLNLYINSKLKIAAAYDQDLDNSPGLKEELKNIRAQIIENYLTDPESMDQLVNEAFERSKKDIRLAHIFIPLKKGEDTTAASAKIKAAYSDLKKGKSFEEAALAYSQDPSVITNKGNIGYITAFSVPYALENVIYSLKPGSFSEPVKSDIGYHIFKNTGERKAAGRIKAAQILLAFPPNADELTKKQTTRLADSLYQLLQKGGEFSKLAREFSHDYISAASGGIMQEFGTGTYEPAFEDASFALKKDGDISKPVLTSYGYHIIKRISKTEVPSSLSDRNFADNLKSRVQQDGRMETVKEKLYQQIISKAGYKESDFDKDELWKFSDSLLNGTKPGGLASINGDTPLFKLGEKLMTTLDWIAYAQNNRFSPAGPGLIPYPDLLENFRRFVAMEYYRENLEQYNDDFRNQMNEFKDGTMFFEIMTREVWNKAQNDSTGQKEFYNRNSKKYVWNQSASAMIFYCSDTATASQARKEIAGKNLSRDAMLLQFGEKIAIDSGRYELTQLPGYPKETLNAGKITRIIKNGADETASFARIIKIYSKPEPKSFTEARGAVINDYQEELDRKWTAILREKYPVKVNENVLKTLFK